MKFLNDDRPPCLHGSARELFQSIFSKNTHDKQDKMFQCTMCIKYLYKQKKPKL